MILQKTAKARLELQPGSRQLPQRSRSVLLMAGGKNLDQIHAMLGSDHAALAQQLVVQGYLQWSKVEGSTLSNPALAPVDSASAQSSAMSPSINLAGTRMYLFDLCERLFANRHQTLAQTLRTQLQEARDPTALRTASLSLLMAVEQHAGEERAQALRERLGSLLTYAETDIVLS